MRRRDGLIDNDTYGPITADEHAELRANALPCLRCGMLATVDPVFHASRYGHKPITRESVTEECAP